MYLCRRVYFLFDPNYIKSLLHKTPFVVVALKLFNAMLKGWVNVEMKHLMHTPLKSNLTESTNTYKRCTSVEKILFTESSARNISKQSPLSCVQNISQLSGLWNIALECYKNQVQMRLNNVESWALQFLRFDEVFFTKSDEDWNKIKCLRWLFVFYLLWTFWIKVYPSNCLNTKLPFWHHQWYGKMGNLTNISLLTI